MVDRGLHVVVDRLVVVAGVVVVVILLVHILNSVYEYVVVDHFDVLGQIVVE